MNALPLAGGLALTVLIACSTTNKAPPESEGVPASGAAPVAVAPADPAPAPAPAAPAEPRAKVDVLKTAGTFHYTATGGRSPYERVECKISWEAGGADAHATAVIIPRPGRFKTVKRPTDLEAAALKASWSEILSFDPMSLAEQQPAVGATDLHTYTVELTLGDRQRTVTGYGLADGSDFEALVRGMDKICDMDSAFKESRAP